jgi:WD40 repeat protein
LDARGAIAGALRGFARDREEVFTYSQYDHTVRAWDVSGPAPKQVRESKLPAAGRVMAVSPDGRFAAGLVPSGDSFLVWDLGGAPGPGRRVHQAAARSSEYFDAAFSPSSDKLAVQHGMKVLLFDVRDLSKPPAELPAPREAQYRGPFDLAFSPDGTRLAGQAGDTIAVWNLTATQPQPVTRLMKKDAGVIGFAFSADGATLHAHYWRRDGVVWDLSATPPAEKGTLPQPLAAADAFAMTNEGSRVYAGIGPAVRGFDRTADGWRERRPLVGHAHAVTALAFAADGRTIYSADDGDALQAWELDGGRFTEKRVVASFGAQLLVTPDDRTLIGGTFGFSLWDAATLTRRGGLLDRRSHAPVRQALSANGRWLARGGYDPALSVYDLAGREPREHAAIKKLRDYGIVSSVAVSPDGSLLALALDLTADAAPVLIWQITDGGLRPLAFPHVAGTALQFAPDGHTLAVADRTTVNLLDLTPSAPATRCEVKLGPNHQGHSVQLLFSPDGTRLVTVRERTVAVWSVADGQKVTAIELPVAPQSAALAPDGRHLAVGNPSGTVWIIRLAQLLTVLTPAM